MSEQNEPKPTKVEAPDPIISLVSGIAALVTPSVLFGIAAISLRLVAEVHMVDGQPVPPQLARIQRAAKEASDAIDRVMAERIIVPGTPKVTL